MPEPEQQTAQHTWLIEPRDPLIARDGRPFGPNPGARAATLPFPFPSTVAGAVRTLAGSDAAGLFAGSPTEVLKHQVRGPLLVEVDDNKPLRFLVPAPADALFLPPTKDDPARVRRRWLVPLQVRPDAQCGWPDGTSLQPVGQATPSPDKPLSGSPRFWSWDTFQAWLKQPGDDLLPFRAGRRRILLDATGHDGPKHETRMHVRINRDMQSAEEGMLFQTAGLEFTYVPAGLNSWPHLAGARRLALACVTDAPLREGVTGMGGERRLVRWRPVGDSLPECPPKVRSDILAQSYCRLVLLTPAYFAEGFLPTWLLTATPGVIAAVIGVVAGRPQVVSGWDLAATRGAKQGAPKPTRKLAPAGAIYYLKLKGKPEAIEQFIDATWMQNVSDDEQSRRDGFGLAALGVWDGNLRPMEVK